jgi:hypothetical protein
LLLDDGSNDGLFQLDWENAGPERLIANVSNENADIGVLFEK